ncbi:MAG: hypothetical protein KF709_04330 [Gemmatimonadaceae bacterium]|nr:hypothetical protein [Gemmatimonadaceae bacterium]
MRLNFGLAALVLCWAAPAKAQRADPRAVSANPQWELFADAGASRTPDAFAGAGVNLRAGWYVRVAGLVSAGAVRGRDDVWRGAQRADFAVRFHLDPFGERPRGLYGGAGVSARFVEGRADPVLTLHVGVEGARRGAWIPAAELSMGGGLRLGVALRRTRQSGTR